MECQRASLLLEIMSSLKTVLIVPQPVNEIEISRVLKNFMWRVRAEVGGDYYRNSKCQGSCTPISTFTFRIIPCW
ncbi:protein of unknown function [Pseudomonas sp. JV241A]|nr:protein of unknown function [Pseudomonas sp. JV241A]